MNTRMMQVLSVVALAMTLGGLSACSNYQKDPDGTAKMSEEAQLRDAAAQTIRRFRAEDPTLDKFFNTAAGYAVFPEVAKGGAGIGGAYGKGVLYENGMVVGYCSVKQATIGAQLGGQTFSEMIFFENQRNVETFKAGDVEFSAEATAVAASKGAAAKADYAEGIAIFILGQQGLMAEAAIGGQKFNYWTD